MQADLPHTLYKTRANEDKKGSRNPAGKPNTAFKFDSSDPAIAMQKAANMKRAARRKAKENGEEPYTTNELFRKE